MINHVKMPVQTPSEKRQRVEQHQGVLIVHVM